MHMCRSRLLQAVVIAVLSMLFLTPIAARAADPTPEARAAAMVRPSMVYIEIMWSAVVQDHRGAWLNDGKPYRWGKRCSGFIVNPTGYVVTAGHCVDDGLEGARADALEYAVKDLVAHGLVPPAQARQVLQFAYGNFKVEGSGAGTPPDRVVRTQLGKAVAGLPTAQTLPARVVDFRPVSQGDVALLKIEGANLSSIEIAKDADVQIGTPILSVGYPGSSDAVTDQTLEPTYKDGKISSKKTRQRGLLPVYEISAAVSGGMSGGPTVTLDGLVVGVNSFKIDGEQQFNFVSPAPSISEILARNGVKNELGPIDQLYRAGLASFFAGDYRGAMTRFDEVLARVPSHQQAQEFRARAAEAAPNQPAAAGPALATTSSGRSPWSTVLLLLVGLLLVGGGGAGTFWFLRRRQPVVAPAIEAASGGLGPAAHPSPPPVPSTGGAAPASVAPEATMHVPLCPSCRMPVAPQAESCPHCGQVIALHGGMPPVGVLVLDDGSRHDLDCDYVVGREPGIDPAVLSGRAGPLSLTDDQRSVSRVHAEIRLHGQRVTVIDRGSANGTFVRAPQAPDWTRLSPGEPVEIESGSQVAFGRRVGTFNSRAVAGQPS